MGQWLWIAGGGGIRFPCLAVVTVANGRKPQVMIVWQRPSWLVKMEIKERRGRKSNEFIYEFEGVNKTFRAPVNVRLIHCWMPLDKPPVDLMEYGGLIGRL